MDQETITVVWGEELIAPVQYNSFRVGPFTMQTKIQKGETPEQAFERAYNFLNTQAKATYVEKLREHKERLAQAGVRR